MKQKLESPMNDIGKVDNGLAKYLPCPFCGSAVFGYAIEPHDHSPALKSLIPELPAHEGSFCIECAKCGCGLLRQNENDCATAWNSRPDRYPSLQSSGNVRPGLTDEQILELYLKMDREFNDANSCGFDYKKPVIKAARQFLGKVDG